MCELLVDSTNAAGVPTDEAVQGALRALRGVTLITIAHRLETIADYDKVLVLDAGAVACATCCILHLLQLVLVLSLC